MCVGLSAKVVRINEGMAVVDADGAKREVSAELLDELDPGDYVMVHAGVAIAKITDEDESETHEIFRLGIRKLLPEQVELISGPGCPVCVTQVGFIDEAIYLALERQVTICTFGDLVRVPGTNMSLAGARERGAKIRIGYSPVDGRE